MTTYFNDCSSVTGWSERIKTGRGWASSSGVITLVGAGTSDWNYLTLDAVEDGNHANVEILAKYTTPSSLGSARYPLIVRGAGSDESATGYSIRVSTSAIRIYYCSGSDTPTQVTSATAAFTFSTSTTYWIRFRVNGSSLKARVWADGGSEPGTWDIDVTDSNVTAAGWNGLSDYSTTADGGTVDQIGFGTNGDSAPSSAGGGGATITADSGTFALSGTAVDLKANRKLSAESGTFALTGSDVALRFNRRLAADSGTFTFNGSDVAFARGLSLAAESGSYTLSGTDVSLKAGRKLAAESGTYSISGSDVTLTYSPAGAYTLTAESGGFTLTGSDAALRVNRKLAAESGTFSLTGSDVGLARAYTLDTESGTYVLTGSDVAFARTYRLVSESGSYVLAGSDVSLVWSGQPVDVTHVTGGGGSRPSKRMLVSERKVREEVDEYLRKKSDAALLRQIQREDDEFVLIMAALAA